MAKERKPPKQRLLATVSVLCLISSVIYILIEGLDNFAGAVLVIAALSLAAPSAAAGDTIFEIAVGSFEMLVEGVQTIVEAIVTAVSSIF